MPGKVSKDARAGACAEKPAENTRKKTEKKTERSPLEKAKRQIVDRMKALGTYKPQYTAAIDRTAELYVELGRLAKEYKKFGCVTIVEHTNKAGATNLVKSPIRCAIEDVYNLLLAYERELGLTPAAMKKLGVAVEEKQQKSPIELALEKLGGG